MKSSVVGGLLVAMSLFSVLNVGSAEADDPFGPTVVPTAKQFLRLVYEEMPIPPNRVPSTSATTDDWCRFSMKLETEAVKGAADGQCKLMGELLVECSDSTMGDAIKRLSKPGARLPRFGIGPCVEAKKHEGACVLELSHIHPADISADGKADCSAWVASTSCSGNMKAGYDQAKGDKADSCGGQKASFAMRRSANYNSNKDIGSCRMNIDSSVTEISGGMCRIDLSNSYECDNEELKKAGGFIFGLIPSLSLNVACSNTAGPGKKSSCVITVGNMAPSDFDSMGQPKVCGDWTIKTECTGTKGDNKLGTAISVLPCASRKRLGGGGGGSVSSGVGDQWACGGNADDEACAYRGLGLKLLALALCALFAVVALL